LKVGGIAELAKEGTKEGGTLHSGAKQGISLNSKFVTGTDEAKIERASWLDVAYA
jgi:hypothetical protein